jgi:hypothetical protein
MVIPRKIPSISKKTVSKDIFAPSNLFYVIENFFNI